LDFRHSDSTEKLINVFTQLVLQYNWPYKKIEDFVTITIQF
jgi:hypothetical protein